MSSFKVDHSRLIASSAPYDDENIAFHDSFAIWATKKSLRRFNYLLSTVENNPRRCHPTLGKLMSLNLSPFMVVLKSLSDQSIITVSGRDYNTFVRLLRKFKRFTTGTHCRLRMGLSKLFHCVLSKEEDYDYSTLKKRLRLLSSLLRTRGSTYVKNLFWCNRVCLQSGFDEPMNPGEPNGKYFQIRPFLERTLGSLEFSMTKNGIWYSIFILQQEKYVWGRNVHWNHQFVKKLFTLCPRKFELCFRDTPLCVSRSLVCSTFPVFISRNLVS